MKVQRLDPLPHRSLSKLQMTVMFQSFSCLIIALDFIFIFLHRFSFLTLLYLDAAVAYQSTRYCMDVSIWSFQLYVTSSYSFVAALWYIFYKMTWTSVFYECWIFLRFLFFSSLHFSFQLHRFQASLSHHEYSYNMHFLMSDLMYLMHLYKMPIFFSCK